jgi:curved DNA-binding protein CbpA
MDLIQVYVKYDLYELLELEMSAETTTNDIKKKYKKLAIKFHPDKYLNSDELSDEEKKTLQAHFNIVGVAYDILSNEVTRSTYDKARKEYLDAGQYGDLKKQFGDFLGKAKTETESTKLEFTYGDEKTCKKVFKEENIKLNTDNEKIAEEIREKTKKNLNTTYDINKVENFDDLLTTSSSKNEKGQYMSKFNTLFDTFRQKTATKNTEIMSYNQDNSNASLDEAFGLIKLTETTGASKFEDAFNLMDVSDKDYVDNNLSLAERISAYDKDSESLKIPNLKKENK